MTDPLPPVASLRVEKPGKSKFAPVISADRRKPLASTAVGVETTTQAEPSSFSVQGSTPPTVVPPSSSSLAGPTSPVRQMPPPPPSMPAASGAQAIQSIQQRRQQQQQQQQQATPNLVKRTAQSIASELVQQTESMVATVGLPALAARERPRVTMASFLQDSGEGLPMPADPLKVSSHASSSTGSPTKKIVTRSLAQRLVPQVRIVGGQIVMDETMAVAASSTPQETEMTVVQEATHKALNSHAFIRRRMTSNRWSARDTDRFYEALSQCGTDFTIMATLFADRTREQIKGKYRIEERTNPARISAALRTRKPFDLTQMNRAAEERKRRDQSVGVKEEDASVIIEEERKRGRRTSVSPVKLKIEK